MNLRLGPVHVFNVVNISIIQHTQKYSLYFTAKPASKKAFVSTPRNLSIQEAAPTDFTLVEETSIPVVNPDTNKEVLVGKL